MRIGRLPLKPFIILTLWTLFCAWFLFDSFPFKYLNNKLSDTLFQIRADHKKPSSYLNKIVVVGIDDISFKRMNAAWPWGRQVFAEFLDKVQPFEPAVVAFDFAFTGKSQSEEGDRRLAEAMSRVKNVIVACYYSHEVEYILPLVDIGDAVRSYGFINKSLDKDGVHRKVRTLVEFPGPRQVFSFAIETVYAYWGWPPAASVRLQPDRVYMKVPDDSPSKPSKLYSAPLDSNARRWMSFRYRQKDFKYISFWKIMAGEITAEELKGKIVEVGATSAVMHDVHQTPLGRMSGVYINANEIMMLLEKDFVHPFKFPYQWALLMALALGYGLVFSRFRFPMSTLVFIVSEAGLYLVSLCLLMARNVLLEPFPFLFAVGSAYFIVLVHKSVKTFMENLALQKEAIPDGLTGLYAHRYLSLRLEADFKKFQRTNEAFHFAMLDVDFFKKVNDTYGHPQGDAVLTVVARILKDCVRGYDVVARYGGEEFAIIFHHNQTKDLYNVLERIRKTVEAYKFLIPKGHFNVTVSSGLCAITHPQVASKEDLVRLADEALYQAKHGGRNRVCVAEHPVVPPDPALAGSDLPLAST